MFIYIYNLHILIYGMELLLAMQRDGGNSGRHVILRYGMYWTARKARRCRERDHRIIIHYLLLNSSWFVGRAKQAASRSLKAVFWVFLLLFTLIYIGALFCASELGSNQKLKGVFGNIWISIFSHFKLMTLEQWVDICSLAMEVGGCEQEIFFLGRKRHLLDEFLKSPEWVEGTPLDSPPLQGWILFGQSTSCVLSFWRTWPWWIW